MSEPLRAPCDSRYCLYCKRLVMTEAEYQTYQGDPDKAKRDPGCPECKKVGRSLSIRTFLIAKAGCELPEECTTNEVPGYIDKPKKGGKKHAEKEESTDSQE